MFTMYQFSEKGVHLLASFQRSKYRLSAKPFWLVKLCTSTLEYVGMHVRRCSPDMPIGLSEPILQWGCVRAQDSDREL